MTQSEFIQHYYKWQPENPRMFAMPCSCWECDWWAMVQFEQLEMHINDCMWQWKELIKNYEH